MDAFSFVKAKLSQQTGSEWSDEQVRRRLARKQMTPEQWLEWNAELAASVVDAPLRIPDPDADPEGYAHYEASQFPPGLGEPAKKKKGD